MNIAGKKVAYVTLGCKLNFSETSTIRQSLEQAGTLTVDAGEGADIYVINTCSVTDMAEKKGRQLIRKVVHHHPGVYVVVVGCYAQLRREELESMDGVSLVLGTGDKFNVEHYLRHLEEETVHDPHGCDVFKIARFDLACSFGDRTRCFLKIQDGCDYFCSYCTIPFARGRSRSASPLQIAEAVKRVVSQGVREVVLTGVNTGDFGKGSGSSFLDLLRMLDEVQDVARFRISSIEPNLLSDEIIEFVGFSRHFMPHFHIPLQSGSNAVLKLMHRHYDRELFASKVGFIRRVLPDAFIGVDVIAGMRGETEGYFEEGRQFVEQLPISRLHVFPYSERQGTKALEIPYSVSQEEKHRRVDVLLEISDRKLQQFYHHCRGQVRPVLFEDHRSGGFMYGFTDNYIKVRQVYDLACVNRIVPVCIGENICIPEE